MYFNSSAVPTVIKPKRPAKSFIFKYMIFPYLYSFAESVVLYIFVSSVSVILKPIVFGASLKLICSEANIPNEDITPSERKTIRNNRKFGIEFTIPSAREETNLLVDFRLSFFLRTRFRRCFSFCL